jgi:hypothetical protein
VSPADLTDPLEPEAESDGAARSDADPDRDAFPVAEPDPSAEADAVPDARTTATGKPGSIFAATALPTRSAIATAWPRRYAIMSETSIIGYTDLEFSVTPGREAAGVVIPAHGFRPVHDVFALYHEAGNDPALLRRFVEARDALGLLLTDGSGAPLDGKVELISVSNPRRLVAHIAIEDPRFWNAQAGRTGQSGHAGRVAGRGQSPWAALHAPVVSAAARPRATWGSAWTSAEGRPRSAMTRRDAEQLRHSWGDQPCEHPAVAKEYVGAAHSGILVCTQCGAAVPERGGPDGSAPGRDS